jgi:hypothetical protein
MVVLNRHLNGPPPAILKAMPDCPIPLARLVGKMLKKQRRERHASYEELIAHIESVRIQVDPSLPAAIQAVPIGNSSTSEPFKARKDRRAAPDQGMPGEPSPPGKSPRPLQIAVTASVLMLAIAGYILWPKEEKLTAAQRWAREHASEKKAVAASGPPSSLHPPTSAPAAESTSGWQPLFTD